MTRNKRFASTSGLFLLVVSSLSIGCSATAMMVPVEGPLSQRQPVPVIQAKASGVMGNSGDLTFTLPDGDACKGRWSSAAGTALTVGGASLLGQYGSTYITGWSASTGAGQNPGQAIVTCASGNVVQMEFVTGAGSASGFGIAKDSAGNVFRVVF